MQTIASSLLIFFNRRWFFQNTPLNRYGFDLIRLEQYLCGLQGIMNAKRQRFRSLVLPVASGFKTCGKFESVKFAGKFCKTDNLTPAEPENLQSIAELGAQSG